jgi:hypothetical protein
VYFEVKDAFIQRLSIGLALGPVDKQTNCSVFESQIGLKYQRPWYSHDDIGRYREHLFSHESYNLRHNHTDAALCNEVELSFRSVLNRCSFGLRPGNFEADGTLSPRFWLTADFLMICAGEVLVAYLHNNAWYDLASLIPSIWMVSCASLWKSIWVCTTPWFQSACSMQNIR